MADRPDSVDGLARPGDVVRDLNGSAPVAVAIDQCSGVCQYPGSLQQRERTETHEQLAERSSLSQGENSTGIKERCDSAVGALAVCAAAT